MALFAALQKKTTTGLQSLSEGFIEKIMNASAVACHRGVWDNSDLMHTAAPCLLGNMYTWISDSYTGSLETSAILFIPS